MIHGDGAWAPAQETAGMCARHLPVVVLSRAFCLEVLGIGHAGQGAHREVGSEGFAANHRAVAEQGEPVGQNPGDTEPALRRRRKYLECLGASGCVRAARWERSMRYPGRSRTVPHPTGSVPGRISRQAKSPGMLCEKSEWPAVLMNRGRAKASGPPPLRGGGRRPKRRRPGGRGHVGRW